VRTGLGGRTSCTPPPSVRPSVIWFFRRPKRKSEVRRWGVGPLHSWRTIRYAASADSVRKYFSTSFAESSRHDGALNESSYNTILSLLFTILSLLFTVDTTSVHKKQVRSKALASRSSLTELLWAAMRDPFPFPTLTKSNLAASSAMSFTRTRSSWEEAPLGRV
jgi:hypothetical protein